MDLGRLEQKRWRDHKKLRKKERSEGRVIEKERERER